MQDYIYDVYLELINNYRTIKATYDLLNKTNDLKIPTHSAGQWLLDNMYIIETQYNAVKSSFVNMTKMSFPNVKPYDQKEQMRIYFMANEIVEKNSGVVDDGIVSNYISNFQKHSYVTYNELAHLSLMLTIAVIKYMKRLCISITDAELQKLKVEKRLSTNNKMKEIDLVSKKIIKDLGQTKKDLINKNKVKSSNTAYIEYMAYRLKDMGAAGDKFLQELNDETNKAGFNLDEAIEKEHSEIAKITNLMSAAITSLKTIGSTNWGEVIVSINRIDELLKEDYTKEYARCDHKTKDRYRHVVIKFAKVYRLSEMYVAKKAVECSEKYQKHVGHFLIGQDVGHLIKALGKSTLGYNIKTKMLQPILPIIHILNSLIIAGLFTWGMDAWFSSNYDIVIRVLLNIVLFMFGREVADKLISYFAGKLVSPQSLPRFNFAKTIDAENSTMIAMPTVMNSADKLRKMINKLEVTYLANRSQNMYYMLLGDCTSASSAQIPLDKEIIELGEKLIAELNEKYPSNPKLFNFLYRKRIYSEGEECYMGWERKRGALTELNMLVLGKLTDEQINSKMYLAHRDLPKVKYMITIDEDTQLSLNSAKDLVAIISHPLNKPVLSKNGKVVKSGYGLIQPSIGLDIESANKSLFSKVIGGFGGLDIYTNAVSNLYQDLFGEAIYTGKGIYDIEVFDKLIGQNVPENLILSHDLLEGSYMRTGLASDVELQDGFPSNFIAYTKRNHRWFRGDMQIVSWIFKRTGLNILSRWKIRDNLRREFLAVWVLLFIVGALFLPNIDFLNAILISFVTINLGYLLSILDEIIFGKNAEIKQKQYIPVIYGLRANLLKMVENFITIPYKAWTVIHAFSTSLYRMLISKKKLLEWATADTLDKNAKEKVPYFYKNMWPNILIGLVFLGYGIASIILDGSTSKYILSGIIGVFMLIAPYAAYVMSKKVIFEHGTKLSQSQRKEVLDIGYRTWKFFDSTMTEANNFLPPDNFQENRRPKIVNRTSSTNIGYGILAIINALDLKYISVDTAISKLYNTFKTIDKLETWNGHLYNWYNTRTLVPLSPRFVSTVDSGNFVACLYVAKTFLEEIKDKNIIIDNLREQITYSLNVCNKFINQANFATLYVPRRNVFSIGYNVEENKLVDSYYDMLMSESRLTSLIAIARSEVTSKHWFALARNLVKKDGNKGLLSWSGTSFEYYMPNLFTKTYKYTLIDEALDFALSSQMKYAAKSNVPWGISESAFVLQDNEQNYQYKAFGVPWLGLKRGLNDSLVISPYSSLMCIAEEPKKVYNNIINLKKYNSYSNYGFYEAIDFTKAHLQPGHKYELVKTYMAHHQGMILAAINNYINDGIIKERFHKNPCIDAADILLKERIPLGVPVKDNKEKYTEPAKIDYTSYIAYVDKDKFTEFPGQMLGTHTNGKLSTIILDNGVNYMYFNDKAITKNRYMDKSTMGNTMVFTNRNTGEMWSYAYEPNYKAPDDYGVYFSLDLTSFARRDGHILTKTEISVAPEYNMEIRKVTLKNYSDERVEMLVNTSLDLAMSHEAANIVHPAFNNLLIEETFDEDLKALVAKRRSRDDANKEFYVFSKLINLDLDIDYETEKSKLVENGGKQAYDGILVKYPLSPVMSYRARLFLDPGEKQTFYYILGASDNKYNISHTIVNATVDTLEKQIKFSAEKESISAKYLKLKSNKIELYNKILQKVMFAEDDEKLRDLDIFWDQKYSQDMLWRFGISGDIPMITVRIGRIEDSALLDEVINFMQYVKFRKIDVDIVLLVDEELYSGEPIKQQLTSILSKVAYMSYTRGNIYVVNLKQLSEKEYKVFEFLARVNIKTIDEFMPKLNMKEDNTCDVLNLESKTAKNMKTSKNKKEQKSTDNM